MSSSKPGFSTPIRKHFATIDPGLQALNEEQALVLDYLSRHRRVAIYGCAGSGKTLVAVEKAIRLDREKCRVLLLCHNPALAQYIKQLTAGTQIAVADFRTYVNFLVDHHLEPDFSPRQVMDLDPPSRTLYPDPSHQELVAALDQLRISKQRFDAVVVDEGQDIQADWWQIIAASLQDPQKGIFYIFFDDNQAIYPAYGLTYYFPVPVAEVFLSQNCRNAGEIYELIRPLHEQSPDRPLKPEGKGIVKEFIFTKPGSHFVQDDSLFENLYQALLFSEHYSKDLKDIVVMVESAQNNRLNGYVFDSPQIQGNRERGHLRWQPAVLRYLIPFGLKEADLSDHAAPTQKDIEIITQLCKSILFRRRIRPRASRQLRGTRWVVDRYGDLKLSWNLEDFTTLSERDVLSFFSQKDFMSSYPSNYKRYRLTTLEDMAKYPQFFNVRLVDIPTFKGLEADGVVLVWEELIPFGKDVLRSNLYVALSRAKYLLAIVSPYGIREKIAELR